MSWNYCCKFSHGTLLLPLFVLGSACVTPAAPRSGPLPEHGRLITADQIEQSGGENVLQVLRRSGTALHFIQDRAGQSVATSRRGQVGANAGGQPLVVLDGTLTEGVDLLHLAAAQVESIRVLSALQATRLYGMRGGAGAILIETRRGPRR